METETVLKVVITVLVLGTILILAIIKEPPKK